MSSYRPPPVAYKIVKYICHNLLGDKGVSKAFNLLDRLGCLEGTADFPFYDRMVEAPLDWVFAFSNRNLSRYQIKRIQNFYSVINTECHDFNLIDCGADIGLMSLHIGHNCPGLVFAAAIEPNGAVLPVLRRNFANAGL